MTHETRRSVPMLRLHKVHVSYDPQQAEVLRCLSLEVNEGEIVALLGPSGAGKTTTLRIVAGFEPLVQGRVEIGGEVVQGDGAYVTPDRRLVGFVFQNPALFPHLRVQQNIEFGVSHLPTAERRRRREALVELFDLSGLERRWPHDLSGGERQRVALARALAPRPRLLLLDEPFSSLDAGLRAAVRAKLRSSLKEWGTTVLLVTHDQEEAMTFADRVGVITGGRIEQVGTPEEIYAQPETSFVATFLGDTNVLRGKAQGVHAETPIGEVRLDREAQGDVRLSIRPEHLHLASANGDGRSGRVVSREFKGHDITFCVEFADRLFRVQTDYSCGFRVGQSVRLVPKEPAVVLDETSE